MTTYTVQEGDTLTAIAKRFNTTVAVIQSANKKLIKDVNSIQVGWKLNIPVITVNDSEIKNQYEKVVKDIANLDSVKQLEKMLGGQQNGLF